MKNKKEYLEYIKSEDWKKKKSEIIEERGLFCEHCGKEFPRYLLFLHHTDYIMEFGKEKKESLILLCKNCHSLMHEDLNEGEYNNPKNRCTECNKEMIRIKDKTYKCIKCGICFEYA